MVSQSRARRGTLSSGFLPVCSALLCCSATPDPKLSALGFIRGQVISLPSHQQVAPSRWRFFPHALSLTGGSQGSFPRQRSYRCDSPYGGGSTTFLFPVSCFTKKCVVHLILIYGSENRTNSRGLLQRHDEGTLDVVSSLDVGANVVLLLLVPERILEQGNINENLFFLPLVESILQRD